MGVLMDLNCYEKHVLVKDVKPRNRDKLEY